MSFTRAHYELYTYRLRIPYRMTTSVKNQLHSIDRSMYAHWVVLPREWSVSHITLPYVSDPAP